MASSKKNKMFFTFTCTLIIFAHVGDTVPIVLVGNKKDLWWPTSDMVFTKNGLAVARAINAYKYFECSALKNNGISMIFEAVVNVHLLKRENKERCNLL